MELRTLEYFLAVAREGNISNAAKALHITQPTLSRQLSSLEKEFGRELYTRGPKGIELTDQGSILCRYAESIVELAHKAEEDMLPSERSIGGTVHIGAGESQAMALIAQAMDEVRRTYPAVDFAIHSGTTAELKDGLVRGFYDVMLECEMREHAKMNAMRLPVTDVWGALALRDSAVGRLEGIAPSDLAGQGIIVSRQALAGTLRDWAGDALDRMMSSLRSTCPRTAVISCVRAWDACSPTRACSTRAKTATFASSPSPRASRLTRASSGGPPCPTSRRRRSSTPWNAYARGMWATMRASRRPHATVSAFPEVRQRPARTRRKILLSRPSSRRHETSI